MPAFTQINATATVDVDFEVFCGTCGAGLCNQSNTRQSRSRNDPQVTVEACEKCMENAKEEGRSSRDDEVAELESKIEELENEILDLQQRA